MSAGLRNTQATEKRTFHLKVGSTILQAKGLDRIKVKK